MNHLIVRLLIAFVIAAPVTGYSQDMPPKMEEAFRNAISVNGFVDRESHQKFWSDLSQYDKENTNALIKWIRGNLLLMQEYNGELWDSALISYRNRKIVKTERLIDIQAKLPSVLNESLPFRPGSKEYAVNTAAINRRLDAAIQNANNLLFAASTHSEFRSVNGDVFPLDENRILEVIKNIHGSVYRVSKLLNREWQE